MNRKRYIQKILKILKICDLWTLDQIYRVAVNITK